MLIDPYKLQPLIFNMAFENVLLIAILIGVVPLSSKKHPDLLGLLQKLDQNLKRGEFHEVKIGQVKC